MTTRKTLDQLAYGHATAKLINSTGTHQCCWYESYEYLAQHVSQPEKLKGWTPVQPYEDNSWTELLELIDFEAQVILEAMQSALELAKQGLVLAATSKPLKEVFNGIDMQ